MARASFFTIEIDDVPRVLFSVQQRSSGDLTIIIKHGVHMTSEDSHFVPDKGHTIIEQRISVHTSPRSPDINALKTTVVLQDGRRLITNNYTRAIKRGNRFAPLYSERCRDLSNPRYIIKDRASPSFSLGRYSPPMSQLVYQIFVGSASNQFRTYCKHDINLIQHQIGAFKIVVIWSYLLTASDSTGEVFAFKTETPEEIATMNDPGLARFMTGLADGYDEESCVELFRFVIRRLRDIYLGKNCGRLPVK
jgi:hypothetical protein